MINGMNIPYYTSKGRGLEPIQNKKGKGLEPIQTKKGKGSCIKKCNKKQFKGHGLKILQ